MGTYGIVRRIAVAARFSGNLLAGFVLFHRDDEVFGIKALDAIWERHDGRMLRFASLL